MLDPSPLSCGHGAGADAVLRLLQQRRTLMDLDELFDAVGTTTAADGARSAPMRLLPELIDQFEARRGVELLSEDEKKQLVRSLFLSCLARRSGSSRTEADATNLRNNNASRPLHDSHLSPARIAISARSHSQLQSSRSDQTTSSNSSA